MPEIPEGATRPADHQAAAIKPNQHSPGWDLLRPPIDLEFWEVTDFTALVLEIPTRGDQVSLNAKGLRAVGACVKVMQEVFAHNSSTFKAWVRETPGFQAQAEKVLPLIFEYSAALGEALSSES